MNEVTVTFTEEEAMRLFASASFYETTVSRMDVVGDYSATVAMSALDKLATALAELQR
jgi:predicted DNA-binding protein (UPF0251 family)